MIALDVLREDFRHPAQPVTDFDKLVLYLLLVNLASNGFNVETARTPAGEPVDLVGVILAVRRSVSKMHQEMLRVRSPADRVDGIAEPVKDGLGSVSATFGSCAADKCQDLLLVGQGLDFGNEGLFLRRMVPVAYEGKLDILNHRSLDGILYGTFAKVKRSFNIGTH